MLVVCMGLDKEVESLASRTVFSDVDSSSWAAGWINAAAQAKIIAGYPDGTFKPTKNVNYAEAFTMALKALGYGNVVDAEGTWPTAYMLKARELKLTNELVGQFQASQNATRGNTAILLWNMLRTPMWKIYEESEGNGMTLSARNDYMLNVKFPDYRYSEGAFIYNIDVDDKDNVQLTIDTSRDENTDLPNLYTAYVKNIDISRLAHGMKVTVLVKNYKDEEEKTFLTVVPTNTIVEGFVTNYEYDEEAESLTFKVDDVEYKASFKNDEEFFEGIPFFGTYVVFEADGKKVKTYKGIDGGDPTYVLRNLPLDGKEVEEDSVKTMENDIDEDDLVIRDGEWVTVDDVKVGDVYTQVWFDDGYAWYVTSEPLEGTFDSLTTEAKKIDGARTTVYYVEIDGDKLFVALGDGLEAYDGADNDNEVRLAALQEDEKDNKYLDKDVTVVRNFVGSILKLKFGDVDELSTSGSYYVIASNGAWSSSAKGGKLYNITLVGQDGNEEDYEFTRNATIPDEIKDNETIYENEIPQFCWVKFDDDDKIKSIVIFSEDTTPLRSGDGDYKSKYTVVPLVEGEKFDKNDNKFEETVVTVKGGARKELKANASTIVYTVKALLDDDDKVMGFEVEITEGTEAISNKNMPANSYAAYDATKKTARAAYVFIADDPESAELEFGLVEKYEESSRRGKNYVTINGTEYQLEDKLVDFMEDDVVGFTVKNNKITVKRVVTIEDVDYSLIMDKDTDSESIVFTNGEELDLTKDSDDMDKYEDYSVVEVEIVKAKKNSAALKFDSAEKKSTEGLPAVAKKAGNRVLFDDVDKVIYVFKGLGLKEYTDGGYLSDVPASQDPEYVEITYVWADEVELASGDTLPEDEEVEAGSSWEAPASDKFDFDPSSVDSVQEDLVVNVTYSQI
jgi:hypothetical protein